MDKRIEEIRDDHSECKPWVIADPLSNEKDVHDLLTHYDALDKAYQAAVAVCWMWEDGGPVVEGARKYERLMEAWQQAQAEFEKEATDA